MVQNSIVPENFTAESSNPFPASAVAQLSLGAELLTIETDAIRLARSQVDSYLSESNRSKQIGNTLAIVGEYGTGKTHIALEIMSLVSAKGDEAYHLFYLDAPS